jgi:hypothetical protein
MKNLCGAEPPHKAGWNTPVESRRSSSVECQPGGRRGRDASELTSRGRWGEATGEHRPIVGVNKVSLAVLSCVQDAANMRVQGIRPSESLAAVDM